ncbi:TPA: NrdH-redoxin [Candidatus Woesearchaeota archaeon]|nr:NrdH-redoxin [Candidatus Woesearchaeota archaeon]
MAKNVIVYSTSHCPYCIKLKDFLKENNVKYVEYNVEEDKDKANEMVEKSGQMGVPVIDIDGTVIVGFDKQAVAKALRLKI